VKLSGKQQKLKRAKLRLARDRFREMCFSDQLQVGIKFEIDNDLVTMRKPFSQVLSIYSNIYYRDSMIYSRMG
jgi:hypothetical protein